MPEQTTADNLRALPSVDALLRTPEAQALRERVGAEHLTALARAVTEGLRAELRSRAEEPRAEDSRDGAPGHGAANDEAMRVEASRAAAASGPLGACTGPPPCGLKCSRAPVCSALDILGFSTAAASS